MKDLSHRAERVRHDLDLHRQRMQRALRMRLITSAVLLAMLAGACAAIVYVAVTFDSIELANELGAFVKAFREAAR